MAPTISIGTIAVSDYLGIGIMMIVLTAAFVSMRFFTSLKQSKRLLVDDWMSLAAFIISTAFYAFNYSQYQRFFMAPDLSYNIKAAIAVPALASFSMWTSKVPVLVLYVRLFGIKKWLRYTCYAILLVTGIGFLGAWILCLANCRPNDLPLTPAKWRVCGTTNVTSGVIQGAVASAADVAIFLVPLIPIYHLKLSKKKKIGLFVVFLSGILGVVASVLALVYKVYLFRGGESDRGGILTTMLLQMVECDIAIIVGCVPGIRAFWTGYIIPSSVYNSLASIVLATRSRSSRGSKSSRGSGTPGRRRPYHHDEDDDTDKFIPMDRLDHHGTSAEFVGVDSLRPGRTDVQRPHQR